MYWCQPSASSNLPWALPGPQRVLCWGGGVLRWSAARPRLSSHTSNSLAYYCSSSFQVFFFFSFRVTLRSFTALLARYINI